MHYSTFGKELGADVEVNEHLEVLILPSTLPLNDRRVIAYVQDFSILGYDLVIQWFHHTPLRNHCRVLDCLEARIAHAT